MKLTEEEVKLITGHRKKKEQSEALKDGETEALKELGKEIMQMELRRHIYGDY